MTSPNQPRQFRQQSAAVTGIGYLIFLSRWLQAPLYLGLILAQVIYVIVFMTELYHLGQEVFSDPFTISEATIMLLVLGLIDVVMISNLLIMVIIGGYETFVSRIRLDGHPDQPEWLSHVNANVLKVKLAMAIIGISSIHLLRAFIEVNDLGSPNSHNQSNEIYTAEGVFWQVIIHVVFIFSAVSLAWIDKISSSRHAASSPSTEEPSVYLPLPPAAPMHSDASALAIGPSSGSDNETRALHYEQLARELRSR